MSEPRWVTPESIESVVGRPRSLEGLLVTSPAGDVTAPLIGADVEAAIALTSETLAAAGVGAEDRVVVALNSDGEFTGPLYAQAAAKIASAALNVGPRGRLRLRSLIEKTRANVLITTPSGASDLIARLHLEFLADPLDLELRLVIVVGEIADGKTFSYIAREFGARVVEVLADPVFSTAVGHRHTQGDTSWKATRAGGIVLAAPESDRLTTDAGVAEVAIDLGWHSKLSGVLLRTGYGVVSDGADVLPAITRTLGPRILIRGRWVPLDLLNKTIRQIDGVGSLKLVIDRAGTLDSATLHVTFVRDSLIGNPMWRGRIAGALADLTPVDIDAVIEESVGEPSTSIEVEDRRGQHLVTR